MSEHSGASALRATTPSRNSDSDIVDARSASDNIAAASYALSLKSILPHRIIALSKRVDAALAKLYAPYDLDISELMVLAVVAVSARATAKDVSRRTAMHKTKISRAVKQLIQRDLITRAADRADLRQALLSLTPVGRDVYSQSFQAAFQFAELLERAMEPTEREVFHRCFAQLEHVVRS
jgi:DNA-binding MarR family transcriptional regulator